MNKLQKFVITLCVWTSVSVFSNNDFSAQSVSVKEHDNLLSFSKTKKEDLKIKNSPKKEEGKNIKNFKFLPVKTKN